MPDKTPRNMVSGNSGFFQELGLRIKLIVRLMGDKRVNPLLKLLPIVSLVYLFWPLDFVPLNPLDDFGVVGLGLYLFVELCPSEVVREHLAAMRKVIPGEWRDAPDSETVVDGEFHEIEGSGSDGRTSSDG